MRTRLKRASIFLALGLVPAAFLIPAPALPSTATQENFDRLWDGMTEDEVKSILGPPGEYHSGHHSAAYTGISFRRHWRGDEGVIIVTLDWDDSNPNRPRRVAYKSFTPMPPESYGGRWLRQLGL